MRTSKTLEYCDINLYTDLGNDYKIVNFNYLNEGVN